MDLMKQLELNWWNRKGDYTAGTVELCELDGNNWIIGNNGTNGTDWAETIDGADRTYRTFGKLIITLDLRIWLNW